MNFYDKIHEMVKCLKDTEEYKSYMSLKDKVKEDTDLKSKITEFRKKQSEIQMQYISGKEANEQTKKELQDMYVEIIKNPIAAQFFQAEIRLDVVLTDMQKIISDGVKDIVEF